MDRQSLLVSSLSWAAQAASFSRYLLGTVGESRNKLGPVTSRFFKFLLPTRGWDGMQGEERRQVRQTVHLLEGSEHLVVSVGGVAGEDLGWRDRRGQRKTPGRVWGVRV